MKYKISACSKSIIGKVRNNNEDNLLFNNKYLEVDNLGSELKTRSFNNNSLEVFGVFDGMGGEDNGEIASYLAAFTLYNYYNKNKSNFNWKDYIEEANNSILNKMSRIKTMGTTVAGISFEKNKITLCNLGDSRIYGYKNGVITQISEDHTENKTFKRLKINSNSKGKLTQHLGIFNDDMILEPYIRSFSYDEYDKIIICSDGLSDLVNDDKISDLLKNTSIITNLNDLLDEAMKNGGLDNTTIMIFEIKKEKVRRNLIIALIIFIVIILLLVFRNLNNSFKIIKDEYRESLVVGEKYILKYKGNAEIIFDEEYLKYENNYIIAIKKGSTIIKIIDDNGKVLYEKNIKIFPNY